MVCGINSASSDSTRAALATMLVRVLAVSSVTADSTTGSAVSVTDLLPAVILSGAVVLLLEELLLMAVVEVFGAALLLLMTVVAVVI